MPAQDTAPIKEKIVSVIQSRGPSMPVHIANSTGMTLIFSSAFLSELVHEKKIKMSFMRIGSSPLYFLPEQEEQLENFSNYLRSKEKEAFAILKERKLVKDEELDPAIRVAIRGIKDFAIPLEKEGKRYWKYFTTKLEDIQEKPKEIEKPVEVEKKQEETKKFPEIKEEKPVKTKSKKQKKQKSQKQDSQFFNRIKEFLSSKSIEILDIQGIAKTELILKVKQNNEESLVYALNKKKIDEDDLIKANKKAIEQKIKFSIICLGDTPKKVNELINASRNLQSIEKVE